VFSDRGFQRYVATAALFGIFCEALYAASAGSGLTVLRTFSASFLLSLAAASAGAFLGFLFGVPRHINASSDTADRSTGISFNNNFQEISDWLTKILVGIGLIQIRSIADNFKLFVGWIAGSLNLSDAYVVLIIAPYVVLGFILAYLWTVRDYAREETEFIERKHRITDTTLAAEAETILTSYNASQADKKFWGERLSKAVDQNPLNKRIVLVASRYDAEVDFDLDKAITRVGKRTWVNSTMTTRKHCTIKHAISPATLTTTRLLIHAILPFGMCLESCERRSISEVRSVCGRTQIKNCVNSNPMRSFKIYRNKRLGSQFHSLPPPRPPDNRTRRSLLALWEQSPSLRRNLVCEYPLFHVRRDKAALSSGCKPRGVETEPWSSH
jgi:hypothetical protein